MRNGQWLPENYLFDATGSFEEPPYLQLNSELQDGNIRFDTTRVEAESEAKFAITKYCQAS